jgi:hypothetical protein
MGTESTHRFTKAQRRQIRHLAGLAYERELGAAAGELEREFERWRRGEIDVFALSEHIHKFHNGAARDLYKRYAMGREEWSLAWAIACGVVKEPEVDPLILRELQKTIDMTREMVQENEEA